MRKWIIGFTCLMWIFCIHTISFAQLLEQDHRIDLLQTLQGAAFQNNPAIRSAYLRAEAALDLAAERGALPDPVASVGYFISTPETRVGPQLARFSVTQRFPWFGTRALSEHAAYLEADALFQQAHDQERMMYEQIEETLLNVEELDQYERIELENRRILETYLQLAQTRYESGKGTMADILDIRLSLEQSQLSQVQYSQKQDIELARLSQLSGMSIADLSGLIAEYLKSDVRKSIIPDGPVPLDKELDLTMTESLSGSSSESMFEDSLFKAHPKAQQAILKVNAAESHVKLAVKRTRPVFGLGFDYILVGEADNPTLQDSGKDIVMPMASLSIPMFQKKNRAVVNQSKKIKEAFEQEKEAVIDQLQRLLQEVEVKLATSSQQMDLYRRQLDLLKTSRALLLETYSQSGGSFEEVLRVHQRTLEIQKRLVSTHALYKKASVNKAYLTP